MKVIGIHIFTRDLRAYDNKALQLNMKHSGQVIPLFVMTPEQLIKNTYYSSNSVHFMIQSLNSLNEELGGSLHICEGTHTNIIRKMIHKLSKEYDIINITIAKDYTPYSAQRYKKLKSMEGTLNTKVNGQVKIVEVEDYTLFQLGSVVLDKVNTGYKVFTPFYRKTITMMDKIEQPRGMKINTKIMRSIETISLKEAYDKYVRKDTLSPNIEIIGGRKHALKILSSASMKKFSSYDKERDSFTYKTTRLSAYLKFGCVSIRETYYAMYNTFKNRHDSLIRELIWREFYAHLLYHYPQMLKGISLKEKYNNIKWKGTRAMFNRWCNAKTGFPMVDACMRELLETGYMHNRGRMLVSSFLVKILLVDWRWGEKFFAQRLIDYDPASNNGGWMWSSGTGTDSQPYFRILNPWTQSQKHDKDAEYIKRFLPELKDVPSKDIHKWDETYTEWLNKERNINYVPPMVDYKSQREKALALYKSYV